MDKSLVRVFNNPEFGEIRVVVNNGEPWFVAKDVCEILDLGNNRQAIARLEDDEKGVISNDTPGGEQQMSIVSEAGLYSLVLGSKKAQAKPFKRWVTHEVLPSIRKHGAYMTPETIEKVITDPDFIIRLATDLKSERALRQKAERLLNEQEPLAVTGRAVQAAGNSILIGELAKIMAQNGVKIGAIRLFAWLRENGYIMKHSSTGDNVPTQKAVDLGVLEVKERPIHADDKIITRFTAKVTGKGQVYFLNKLLKGAA